MFMRNPVDGQEYAAETPTEVSRLRALGYVERDEQAPAEQSAAAEQSPAAETAADATDAEGVSLARRSPRETRQR